MRIEQLEISERFCGPPGIGSRGYVCGRGASHLGPSVAVRLKAPAPLDTPLRLEVASEQARLLHGDRLIAEAGPATLDLSAPEPVSLDDATEAVGRYLGFTAHAFPRCFVCGPQREPGDGLRIFPGPIEARSLVAAPWVPDASLADGDGSVRPEFLWAALDCSGGFAVLPVPEGKAIVLGELTVQLDAAIAQGEQCTVVGWSLGTEGRKRRAGSAVYDSGGKPIAVGQATWIEVDQSAFTSPDRAHEGMNGRG